MGTHRRQSQHRDRRDGARRRRQAPAAAVPVPVARPPRPAPARPAEGVRAVRDRRRPPLPPRHALSRRARRPRRGAAAPCRSHGLARREGGAVRRVRSPRRVPHLRAGGQRGLLRPGAAHGLHARSLPRAGAARQAGPRQRGNQLPGGHDVQALRRPPVAVQLGAPVQPGPRERPLGHAALHSRPAVVPRGLGKARERRHVRQRRRRRLPRPHHEARRADPDVGGRGDHTRGAAAVREGACVVPPRPRPHASAVDLHALPHEGVHGGCPLQPDPRRQHVHGEAPRRHCRTNTAAAAREGGQHR
eukprot:PhM_4_TR15682/c1_g1_i1/m.98056